jgi:hypothetical protein
MATEQLGNRKRSFDDDREMESSNTSSSDCQELDEPRTKMSKVSKPTKKKVAYKQQFRPTYNQKWPSLGSSQKGKHHAFCSVCKVDIAIAHGGADDCRRHVNCKKHKDLAEIGKTHKNIGSFFGQSG